MIRLTRRLFTWLKTIFKKGGSMGYDFPDFKVEEIVKDCNIEEEATTDGKRNLPPPTAEVFSKTENCVIQKSDQCRQKHVKLCANNLTNNKDKIINYEANLGTEYFSTAEVTKDVKKTEAAAVGKLSRYWDVFPILTLIFIIGIFYYLRREQEVKITESEDKAVIDGTDIFYSYAATLALVVIIVSSILFTTLFTS